MSTIPVETESCAPAVRDALVKSADLRLIGLLLERPSPARQRHVTALASECGDEALRAIAKVLTDVDDPSYHSVFAPGGPISPREAAYLGRRDPGRAMSEVSELYAAFGYKPLAGEPVDHVAVETGFLSWLWMKEAYAVAQGNHEAAEVTAAARKTFIEEHLSVLANGLAKRAEGAPAPELPGLASALVARVGAAPLTEAELDGIEEEDDLSCGACPGEPA